MALDLGYVNIGVRANTREYHSKMQRVSKSLVGLKRLAKGFATVMNTLGVAAVAYGIYKLAGAIKSLAKDTLKTTAEFERLKLILEAVTDGAGKQAFSALNKWAIEMPRNTQQAINDYARLRAMGVNPTIEQMTSMVDMAAKLGDTTKVDKMVRALGRISAMGRMTAREVLMLGMAGIPVADILNKELGLTGDQIRNIADQGIEAQTVIDALFRGFEKRASGFSKRFMHETWQGIMLMLEALKLETQRMVGESGPFQVLKDALSNFVSDLTTEEGKNKLEQFAFDMAGSILGAMSAIASGAIIASKSIGGLIWTLRKLLYAGEQARIGLSVVGEIGKRQQLKSVLIRLIEFYRRLKRAKIESGTALSDAGLKEISFVNARVGELREQYKRLGGDIGRTFQTLPAESNQIQGMRNVKREISKLEEDLSGFKDLMGTNPFAMDEALGEMSLDVKKRAEEADRDLKGMVDGAVAHLHRAKKAIEDARGVVKMPVFGGEGGKDLPKSIEDGADKATEALEKMNEEQRRALRIGDVAEARRMVEESIWKYQDLARVRLERTKSESQSRLNLKNGVVKSEDKKAISEIKVTNEILRDMNSGTQGSVFSY